MDGPSSGVVPSGVSIGVPGAEAEFERRGFLIRSAASASEVRREEELPAGPEAARRGRSAGAAMARGPRGDGPAMGGLKPLVLAAAGCLPAAFDCAGWLACGRCTTSEAAGAEDDAR